MLQHVLRELAWVNDHKCQSPKIIDEMIQLIGHKVLRLLIADLLSQTWFLLLADETMDISNHEQVIITLRWVSENYGINENFFELVRIDATTAEYLYSSLKIMSFL